jgi:hypothetical protein
MAALTNLLRSTPQGDDKLAPILLQDTKRLRALDRYERRALSRRKLAVQLFDRAAHDACNYETLQSSAAVPAERSQKHQLFQ